MKKVISINNTQDASRLNLQESLRCGECLHHKQSKHPSHKELCSKEGIKAFAIAPKCFTPDVTQLAGNSDAFIQVASLFQSYSHKQRRILLAMLRKKPAKEKMILGTKVIFHAMGKDYISNYLSGYVMGYTSTGELIIGGSPDQKSRGRMYFAYMTDTDTLLDASQWRKKKAELKANGRVYDPSSVMTKRNTDNDDPPTIDSAPKAWHDKQERKAKRMSSSIRPVDMAIKIS
jgi:hypothetical protein